MALVGIDIGGSGIKGARVDTSRGELLTDRVRIETPQPSTPRAVMEVAAEVASRADAGDGPIGCTFPAVVRDGVVYSAANVDDSWIGVDGASLLAELTGVQVILMNDADAAGLAEMQYGAGKDHAHGVVIVFTFGTGIGSAVFVEGSLFPNTELGHLEMHGDSAEKRAAARLREDNILDWDTWIERVNEYLAHVENLFSPDLFIFGGGISKESDVFLDRLQTMAPLVAAELRNNAGIVGAAAAAHTAFIGDK